MLKEWEGVRQRLDEGKRRWFSDSEFDLIVWYDHEGRLLGFQLCYDKASAERAITWFATGSYVHAKVDTGESRFGMKEAPTLVSDGPFDSNRVADAFAAAAGEVDREIAAMVVEKLRSYPG